MGRIAETERAKKEGGGKGGIRGGKKEDMSLDGRRETNLSSAERTGQGTKEVAGVETCRPSGKNREAVQGSHLTRARVKNSIKRSARGRHREEMRVISKGKGRAIRADEGTEGGLGYFFTRKKNLTGRQPPRLKKRGTLGKEGKGRVRIPKTVACNV